MKLVSPQREPEISPSLLKNSWVRSGKSLFGNNLTKEWQLQNFLCQRQCVFYETFWNWNIILLQNQNQFVKKSAYDQEISSLKDENSNLQSDVVISYTPITDRTFWMLSTLVSTSY